MTNFLDGGGLLKQCFIVALGNIWYHLTLRGSVLAYLHMPSEIGTKYQEFEDETLFMEGPNSIQVHVIIKIMKIKVRAAWCITGLFLNPETAFDFSSYCTFHEL